jgi:23S rRNA pseudouridine1911/1915/1917 synthase
MNGFQSQGLRAIRFGSVTSTMDVAKELAAALEHEARSYDLTAPLEPFAVFADRQTAGRGRRGKIWLGDEAVAEQDLSGSSAASVSSGQNHSMPVSFGNFADLPALVPVDGASPSKLSVLQFSIAFPGSAIRIPLEWVSVAAGCALYDATEDLSVFLASAFSSSGFIPNLSPRRVYLKWPNDLVFVDEDQLLGKSGAPLGMGKLAGTLVETSFSGSQCNLVILGMGINLLAAPRVGDLAARESEVGVARLQSDLFLAEPLSIIDSLAMRRSGEKPRWLEKWSQDESHRKVVLHRFLESLERELLEYLCVARTVGQLRSLGLARMFPSGTTLSLPEQGQGSFEGLGDDASLLITGLPPVHAGEVSVRLRRVAPPASEAQLQASDAASVGKASKPKGVPSGSFSAVVQSSSPKFAAPAVPSVSASKGITEKGNATFAAKTRAQRDLFMDFGNTRVHWALRKSPGVEGLDFGHIANSTLSGPVRPAFADESLRDLLGQLHLYRRDNLQIVYFSVREKNETRLVMDSITAWLESCYPEMRVNFFPIDLAWLSERSADLKSLLGGYGQTLGIDRALKLEFAMNQALVQSRSVALLSLGTATTLEVVGVAVDPLQHVFPVLLESMILPGIQLGFDSLAAGTGLLPQLDYHAISASDFVIEGGNGTRASMVRGVILGLGRICSALCAEHNVEKLWICGGSAAHFVALEAFQRPPGCVVELAENLGLQSLAQIWEGRSRDRPALQGALGAHSQPFSPVSPLTPLASKDVPPESGKFGFGDQSDRIASSLFLGRKHFRRLVAAGGEDGGVGRAERAQDDAEAIDTEDFRRLGQRIETNYVGERVDRHLGLRFRFHSRQEWQDRILRKELLVEHDASRTRSEPARGGLQAVKHTYRLKPFDQLWLFQPPQFEPGFIKEAKVLKDWGDEIAFHKPGNLVVHATGLYGRNTFLDVLDEQGFNNVFPVHRIDRETSGILLCARTSQTRRMLAELFRYSVMHKMYLAVTRSFVETPNEFVVNAPIGSALGSQIRLKMWVGEHEGAQRAETHFLRLAVVGNYCLYACFPITGRTNQIRVHLAAAGQWIVGDKMYHPNENVFLSYFDHGLSEAVLKAIEVPRQALHNAAIQADDSSVRIFADGPIVCPVAADLMELRIVRDLLEESRLGLSEATQVQNLRDLCLTQMAKSDFRNLPMLGVNDLREPTRLAAEICRDVL